MQKVAFRGQESSCLPPKCLARICLKWQQYYCQSSWPHTRWQLSQTKSPTIWESWEGYAKCGQKRPMGSMWRRKRELCDQKELCHKSCISSRYKILTPIIYYCRLVIYGGKVPSDQENVLGMNILNHDLWESLVWIHQHCQMKTDKI